MTQNINHIVSTITTEMTDGGIASLADAAETLVDSGVDPPDASVIIESLSRQFGEIDMPAVTKIELIVTENCNLQCTYCFVEDKNAARMEMTTALETVDYLFRESGEAKDLSILFFGGEPLLEFDLIQQTVLYSQKKAEQAGKRLHFNMTTNGTLLDRESAAFFRKCGLKYLLSVDGNRDCHDRFRKTVSGEGTFDSIVDKLPLLKKYQPWIGTKMTIVPETVANLSESVQFLYQFGFNQFLFGPADGVIWEDDAVQTYFEQLKILFLFYEKEKAAGGAIRINTFDDIRDKIFFEQKDFWGCRAGRHSLTVNPEGDIYPCSKMYANPKLRSTCKLGSLREGITDPYLRLRLIGMLPTKREHCSTCAHVSTCAGGCFAANFQRSGNIFKPNSECVFTALQARLANDLAE